MAIVFTVIPLLLLIAALADVILREDGQVKHLPKFFWILLIVLLPLVGSILWFTIGREYGGSVDHGSFGEPRRHEDAAARRSAPPRSLTPGSPARSTEEQLAALEAEIEAAEQQERIRRLEAEVEARRQDGE